MEPLFIFHDGTPVKADNAWKTLHCMISHLTLNPNLYDFHSLCIGRTSDLIKIGYPIETVKKLGRWKSNAVYKYV